MLKSVRVQSVRCNSSTSIYLSNRFIQRIHCSFFLRWKNLLFFSSELWRFRSDRMHSLDFIEWSQTILKSLVRIVTPLLSIRRKTCHNSIHSTFLHIHETITKTSNIFIHFCEYEYFSLHETYREKKKLFINKTI